jgi:DNA-binding transcriptional MerR regulator
MPGDGAPAPPEKPLAGAAAPEKAPAEKAAPKSAALERAPLEKAEGAFRTISEVSATIGVPPHILRFWETRFPQLKPLQRGGNRRYYRPADIALARNLKRLLHEEGYTVKGVQKLIADRGLQALARTTPDADASPVRLADRSISWPDVAALRAIRNRLAAAIEGTGP